VSVSTLGSLQHDRHYMKVYTARGDASGERELQWAVKPYPVGNAQCTRTLKVNDHAEAKERTTMIMCWRLSSRKSVYVISVDVRQPPTEQEAMAALNGAWDKMD
jgi:hypothetical protein